MIRNIKELAKEVGVDLPESIDRAIYKETDCGAWVRFNDTCVWIGSIVEGSAAEIRSKPLAFPFKAKAFWDAVQEVNDEACELWDEANEQ